MNILFIISISPAIVSGFRNSLTKLAGSLTEHYGLKVKIVSLAINEIYSYNGVDIYPYDESCVENASLIVFNGLWSKKFVWLGRELNKRSKKYIISPRSSLMYNQFKKSTFKKILFLIFGGGRFLVNASEIHFLTTDEKANSIDYKKSFIVGNSIKMDPCTTIKTNNNKVFGYLGRYDLYHKGLDVYIKAINSVKHIVRECGWVFIMYGSDYKNNRLKIERYITENQISDIIKINGEIHGQEKEKFLNDVTVFVHTSRYEGQPQSVMEAMIYKCAILVTYGTNMSNVVSKSKSGIVVNLNKREISEALCDFMLDDMNICKMQESSHKYAKEYFNEKRVCELFYNQISKYRNN